jgi:hypothetical protein
LLEKVKENKDVIYKKTKGNCPASHEGKGVIFYHHSLDGRLGASGKRLFEIP